VLHRQFRLILLELGPGKSTIDTYKNRDNNLVNFIVNYLDYK